MKRYLVEIADKLEFEAEDENDLIQQFERMLADGFKWKIKVTELEDNPEE